MSTYHECSVQCETECAHEVAATLRARLRTTAQTLIAEVGATGPMDAEQAATRAVERITTLRAEVARLREALAKYGMHEWECTRLKDTDPCTCGLTAVLQETRHE